MSFRVRLRVKHWNHDAILKAMIERKQTVVVPSIWDPRVSVRAPDMPYFQPFWNQINTDPDVTYTIWNAPT